MTAVCIVMSMLVVPSLNMRHILSFKVVTMAIYADEIIAPC